MCLITVYDSNTTDWKLNVCVVLLVGLYAVLYVVMHFDRQLLFAPSTLQLALHYLLVADSTLSMLPNCPHRGKCWFGVVSEFGVFQANTWAKPLWYQTQFNTSGQGAKHVRACLPFFCTVFWCGLHSSQKHSDVVLVYIVMGFGDTVFVI